MLNSSKNFACFHQSKDDSEQRQNVWNSCSVAKTLNPKPVHMLQVGYIVGLGDRHSMNILLDQASAEVVHIDLGVAFEQGLMLKTPERVHLPHYTLMFWTYTLPLQAVLSIWNNAGGLNCTVLWEEFFSHEICCALQHCTYTPCVPGSIPAHQGNHRWYGSFGCWRHLSQMLWSYSVCHAHKQGSSADNHRGKFICH